MVDGNTGIKAHTREERWTVVEKLIPLWKKKFGDNLLGIAVSASVARKEDTKYSDLELEVFLRVKPPENEDQYLQRVVNGMLIEAIYHTPDEFLRERSQIAHHWHLSASDRWIPVFNTTFIEWMQSELEKIHFEPKEFLSAASLERYKLQESFSKVLNAVEMNNHEGISLLLMDAVMNLLQVMALINQQPFSTFSRYISQARELKVKPDGFNDLLDLLVNGTYQELEQVRKICTVVFGSLENIFRQYGMDLYNDELDPNLPNSKVVEPI